MALDSGIAPHLRVSRTLPAKTPPNYLPPYASYSARFSENTRDIVVAIFGTQSRTKLPPNVFDDLLGLLQRGDAFAPRAWDVSTAIDCRGYDTKLAICYWANKPDFVEWADKSGFDGWWAGLKPSSDALGWFKEIFFPPVERFETVFSDDAVPEGAAHMRESVSGAIREHAYWGSARDRLPVAQQDSIAGENYNDSGGLSMPLSSVDTTTKRIRVHGRKNLCVIRSGQDWSVTPSAERKLYLETMHPVLVQGMDFLRDQGREVGCICNRFATTTATSFDGASARDRTFGLGYFWSLEHLERWSREHKTHLDIFGRFLRYAGELGGEPALRLFHEVLVLEAEQQVFEYVGCHDETGMLAAGAETFL